MKLYEKLTSGEVDWKKLGEVCEIKRGERVTKKDLLENGKYPVVSGGIGYMGYIDKYNRDEETITIAQYGTAGYVNWQNNKFWANDVCFCVYVNEKVLKRYIYHFLLYKQEYLYKISNKTAVPYSISKDKILNIEIPITSLENQEKIANILDKFSYLVEELKKELANELKLRILQYEYYRDLLLSEEYLTKKIRQLQVDKFVLRKVTLGEIGEFKRGNGLQKKDFLESGKPVIHYGEIYTKYGLSAEKTFSYVREELFLKLMKAKKNDILIATTSENIQDLAKCVVWLGDETIGFSGDMYSYTTKENSKYIAYYFQSEFFQKQKEKKCLEQKF